MAHVQRSKPECPLCRTEFPATLTLVVNHELRDLVKLTSTLHTVDGADGWQTLATIKQKARFRTCCLDSMSCHVPRRAVSREPPSHPM